MPAETLLSPCSTGSLRAAGFFALQSSISRTPEAVQPSPFLPATQVDEMYIEEQFATRLYIHPAGS
jgi:hypothetical protein